MSDTTGTDSQPPSGETPPAEGGSNKTWLWVALVVVLLVIVGLVVAAVANDSDDDSSDATTTTVESTVPSTTALETTTTTEASPAQVVTVSGTGATNSDPFMLTAERYKVAYSYPGECAYSSALKSTDTSLGFSEELGSGSAVSGETNVFGVQPGEYFIAMTMGQDENCDWEIVLTEA